MLRGERPRPRPSRRALIFEVTATGRPAILIPYPHAAAGHQATNAAWMERGGAATVIADGELGPERLLESVTALLGDEGRLAAMASASKGLAMPDAARRIADEVLAASERGASEQDRR